MNTFRDNKPSKFALAQLLFAQRFYTVTINNITGTLSSIEREDGSGSKFNITLNTEYGKETVFVETID